MKTLLLACLLPGLLAAGPASAQPAQPDMRALAAPCEGCHAPGAPGLTSTTPRLNGLAQDYLEARLTDMLSGLNQSPHSLQVMWSNAHRLNAANRRALAAYFAQQPPSPAVVMGQGGEIYAQGLSDMPACSTCHGATGEGGATAPRLAGQRTGYLVAQLWAFNLVARVHGPMNNTAMKLRPDQIDALAAYLGRD